MRPPRALLLLSSLAFASAVGACNLDNLGDPPPDADIYLPTGLMLSAQSPESAPRFLYVINSNFDLRYNRGSIQAFDLARLDDRLSRCDRPGLDCQIATNDLLADEVLIPSLATSFTISPDRSRLYIATRTDPTVTFIDLDENASGEDVFRCDEAERRCGASRQRGADPGQSPRGQVFPTEPVGMTALRVVSLVDEGNPAELPGDFLLVAHRGGQLSLFHDPGEAGPSLVHVLENLPPEPTGIVFDPISRLAYLSVYARGSASGLPRLVSRVGLTLQAEAGLGASFSYDAGALVIDGVASLRDTRALVMNPAQEGELLVLGRDPSALLSVDVGADAAGGVPATNAPARRIAPVGDGPMRIALGQLGERNIVAISCFDGHSVYILDAATSDVLGIVHNLNGPFELVIDSGRQRLYLADFRSSTVLIIDLAPLGQGTTDARTNAPIIGTLGIPKVVQELQ